MRAWAIAATVVSALTLATPAFAQKSDDTTTAEAKQRFQEGINFAEVGNHEAARLKFSQAWSLLKSPAILYNLARSEQLSGHPVEALEHYRRFAKMSSDPKVTEQQKQRATENIAQLSEKVGQIRIEAPANALVTLVTIDGKAVDWTPNSDPIPVSPGKHEVSATVDGKSTTATVECTVGTVTPAKVVATPANAPPVSPPPAAPENHRGDARAGAEFWTTGRAVAVGLAGAGVVGVALGVVFQLKANSTVDDIDAQKANLPAKDSYCAGAVPAERAQTCNDLKSKTDDVKSAETLRSVFLIGGGALVAGGAALFLLSPPGRTADTRSGWHVVPFASSTDMGIATFGRF